MEIPIAEYFSRDLDEFEERRLEELALKDPEVAEALMSEARRRYLSYGLPDPLRPTAPAHAWARTAALGWSLALAASLALILILPHRGARPSSPPPLAGAKIQWKVSALASGSRGLGFARALSSENSVPVLLTLTRPELVVVKVLDSEGRVLKVLYAGPLPAGRKSLSWDRVDEDGHLVEDGHWRVDLQEGLPLAAGPR